MSKSDSGNTIAQLREHLFATIAALRDKENPMDIARAKAISDVAQTVINSAKVEVEYLRINNGGETPFLESSGNANLPPGVTGVTRHILK